VFRFAQASDAAADGTTDPEHMTRPGEPVTALSADEVRAIESLAGDTGRASLSPSARR